MVTAHIASAGRRPPRLLRTCRRQPRREHASLPLHGRDPCSQSLLSWCHVLAFCPSPMSIHNRSCLPISKTRDLARVEQTHEGLAGLLLQRIAVIERVTVVRNVMTLAVAADIITSCIAASCRVSTRSAVVPHNAHCCDRK